MMKNPCTFQTSPLPSSQATQHIILYTHQNSYPSRLSTIFHLSPYDMVHIIPSQIEKKYPPSIFSNPNANPNQ